MNKEAMCVSVLRLLHKSGPMLQTEIVDAFPMPLYIDVGNAVRALAGSGAIKREKHGSTYLVRLPE